MRTELHAVVSVSFSSHTFSILCAGMNHSVHAKSNCILNHQSSIVLVIAPAAQCKICYREEKS